MPVDTLADADRYPGADADDHRDADGRLSLGREAAHAVRRVLHAGDATGREIGRVLWERVSAQPSVETLSHALAIDLIVEAGAVVSGEGLQGKREKLHDIKRARLILCVVAFVFALVLHAINNVVLDQKPSPRVIAVATQQRVVEIEDSEAQDKNPVL